MITLTPLEMAQLKISNIKAAARPMKAHMKTYDLPYTVSARYTEEGGTIVISRAAKKTEATTTPRFCG